MLAELVRKNRSYRRFYQDVAVTRETLEELVDLGRMCASAANRQPLKYMLSCDATRNAAIFQTLTWAGSLKTWPGPSEGERPAAYIIILGDKEIAASANVDPGISAQTILLGATERGLGGCMLAGIKQDGLRAALHIPERYDILLVVALGKPKEKVVLEVLLPGGDSRYWRDAEQVHHVPKRRLEDVIIG